MSAEKEETQQADVTVQEEPGTQKGQGMDGENETGADDSAKLLDDGEAIEIPNEEEEDEEEGEEREEGDKFDQMRQSLDESLKTRQISPIQPRKESYVPDLDQLPFSYKDNCNKELKARAYCKRFVLHYNHLMDRRRPLFLMPKNECKVKKLVCTTINPTQLPYSDLLDWPDIATFVAQYVNYDTLTAPMDLPSTLYAPQTVLDRRQGHCFDLSTLLCSMLIGSGYDAFVVSGYASREVCNMDLSYTRCPLIEEDRKIYPRPMEREIRRYTVKPPRLYASEYLLRIKTKQEKQFKAAMDEIHRENEEMRKRIEAPPNDPLRGWRVHSWVMVLAGQRDIHKTFFIEPTTGFSHPSDWNEYLGIESIWNHINYYVNVQEGNTLPSTVASISYNIGDSRDWEYIFPGQDLHTNEPGQKSLKHSGLGGLKESQGQEEKHFDLPPSWTLPLRVSRDEYERRYPMGKTWRMFKKALVEYFTSYLLPSGLVRRLTVYSDVDPTKLEYTNEYFAHRKDLLVERFRHYPTDKTIETFADGRDDFLKEHHFFAQSMEPESMRTLLYFRFRRLDQMYKREEGPDFIKQWYDSRPDHKIYKETRFGPNGKIHEEGEGPNSRPIETVVEHFSRNESVPANEDIYQITYSVSANEIDVMYHVEDHRIVRSTRHFTKPDRWWDETVYLDWKIDLHWNFEANVFVKPLSELKLYQIMVHLMNMEAHSRRGTRSAEKETRKLLLNRTKEEAGLVLVKTYNDADRIPETRVARLKEKARIKEEKMAKKMDVIRDYLEPYLVRLGLTNVTNKRQVARIKENIMEDLKSRFINQIDTMRDDYEQLKKEIEIMQDEHAHDLFTFPTSQIKEYDSKLTSKMFQAHILEERMNQFKVYAPIKYKALYNQLKSDPRMAPYMQRFSDLRVP